MVEHRLAVRITGFASTVRGFSFAVTEGPDRLVHWGGYKISSDEKLEESLDRVVTRARPLFVTCEIARTSRKSGRGRRFADALIAVCATHGIMILCVERRRVRYTRRTTDATNHDVAMSVLPRFRVLATRLPRRRKAWECVDERVGLFLAVAAAVAGWNHFRPPTNEQEYEHVSPEDRVDRAVG